jgi:hypothetical protein
VSINLAIQNAYIQSRENMVYINEREFPVNRRSLIGTSEDMYQDYRLGFRTD